MLDSIDSLASNIELSDDGKATVIQPNIAITAQKVTPNNFTGLMFSIATDSDGRLGNDSLSSERPSTASVEVPDTLLQGIPGAERVALSVQTYSTFYVQSSTVSNPSNPIGIIISIDVVTETGKAQVANLDPPISFRFFTRSSSNNATTVCSFWNTSKSSQVACEIELMLFHNTNQQVFLNGHLMAVPQLEIIQLYVTVYICPVSQLWWAY